MFAQGELMDLSCYGLEPSMIVVDVEDDLDFNKSYYL